MPPPPTPRIEFRPWSPALREDFAIMARNPEVVRHIPPGTPWPDERINGFVERQVQHEATRGFSMWWIGLAETGTPIGLCGLQPCPGEATIVEIGWWLQPERQGQGFATEAAQAALDWAWDQTDLPAVVAHTDVGNQPSAAVMQRLGMEDLGVMTPAEHGREGVDIDLIVFRVRRADR